MYELNYFLKSFMSGLPKISLYFFSINLFTFALFGIDKYKAVHQKWRISEAYLIITSLLGGALGGVLGMILFRHKIRKPVFYIFVPIFALIYTALIIYLLIVFIFL